MSRHVMQADLGCKQAAEAELVQLWSVPLEQLPPPDMALRLALEVRNYPTLASRKPCAGVGVPAVLRA
jgi:hypothetical protein